METIISYIKDNIPWIKDIFTLILVATATIISIFTYRRARATILQPIRNEVIKKQIDRQMDRLATQFVINLSILFSLTLVITGLLLLVYLSYPYITPSFINENLELQTVYAILPIIVLMILIFIIVHLVTKYATAVTKK